MNQRNKLSMLLISLLIILILTGCSSGIKYVKTIDKTEIFTQSEKTYYVYFYREGCSGCESIASTVSLYAQKTKSDDTLVKLYGVKLCTSLSDKGAREPLLYRSYTGSDGEGKKGDYKVTGLTAWDKLYIGSTPALIKISHVEGVARSSYIAQGANDIKDYLENLE